MEALSSMAGQSMDGLDPQTASLHSDTMWNFILRLLEVRERDDWDNSSIVRVEGVTVELLMKFVMKLNERQFKPLFMRMLGWSSDLIITGKKL